MESVTSSLTFKGSVMEAVTEAQKKKKLFLVYISGYKHDQSAILDESLWVETSVVEAISRSCVFLHLIHGTVDALNFNALYPTKSIPSISAVGYNDGKLLWQLGNVTASVLVAAIEKSCMNCQLQENAAVVLSAAITAGKPEDPIISSSVDNVAKDSDARSFNNEIPDDGQSTRVSELVSSQTVNSNSEQSAQCISKNLSDLDTMRSNTSGSINVENKSCPLDHDGTLEDMASSNEGNIEEFQQNAKMVHDGIAENANGLMACFKSNVVHLSVRLPDGSNLQCKFHTTDTLQMVKTFIDEQHISGLGSFDLAIPYPRSVFSNEDVGKLLSELGLVSREALIVLPHQFGRTHHEKPGSSQLENMTDDEVSKENGGYLGYLKLILSYMNPLSYFGRRSKLPSSDSRLWQYGPNPAVENYLPNSDRSDLPHTVCVSTLASSENKNAIRRKLGSNIHTLGHDKNDKPFSDRNTFWNGNSTEYDGDSSKKWTDP